MFFSLLASRNSLMKLSLLSALGVTKDGPIACPSLVSDCCCCRSWPNVATGSPIQVGQGQSLRLVERWSVPLPAPMFSSGSVFSLDLFRCPNRPVLGARCRGAAQGFYLIFLLPGVDGRGTWYVVRGGDGRRKFHAVLLELRRRDDIVRLCSQGWK